MWSVIKLAGTKRSVIVRTICKVTAFDLYDKEARKLMNGQSIEVWNNGKLVSRCQYEECKHENG